MGDYNLSAEEANLAKVGFRDFFASWVIPYILDVIY